MALLIAHARYLLLRHGWPLALGLALGLVAAAVVWLGVVPMEDRLAAVRGEQQALLAKRSPQEQPGQDARGRFEALRQRLADEPRTLAAIASIHESARVHGIVLARGEYRLVAQARSPWPRYQITLPASGTYPALRLWLADIIEAEPAASLDALTLRRETSGDAMVEARVRLTVHRRPP
jgi:hypothetical protein